jgi:flagellar motor switch protein FliG
VIPNPGNLACASPKSSIDAKKQVFAPMESAAKYTKAQMAVAALVAIAKPSASVILKQFTTSEVRQLLDTSKAMSAVDHQTLELIVADFESEFQTGSGLINSAGELETMVLECYDESQLNPLSAENMNYDKITTADSFSWGMFDGIDVEKIFEFLHNEDKKLWAIVIGNISPLKANELIEKMNNADRMSLFDNMSNFSKVSPEVEEFIYAQIISHFSESTKSEDDLKYVKIANILNETGDEYYEEYMSEFTKIVNKRDLELIESLTFRFNSIVNIEANHRSLIFDNIPVDILTLALRGVSEEIRESALSVVSQRTRRIVENDLRAQVQVRDADISNARRKITAEVARLAKDGRIQLPPAKIAA